MSMWNEGSRKFRESKSIQLEQRPLMLDQVKHEPLMALETGRLITSSSNILITGSEASKPWSKEWIETGPSPEVSKKEFFIQAASLIKHSKEATRLKARQIEMIIGDYQPLEAEAQTNPEKKKARSMIPKITKAASKKVILCLMNNL